ncbi:MAG: M20/M25/M40 family metallo-hydrolase, partial [Candidatus Marsarchaeota archaeon]|nr:M20/M25/M40 family metallo-hydrolase [Candidatus Marsarchaeota archaeon]
MAKLNDLEILTELVKYDTNSNDAKNYIEITSFIKQFAEKNGGKVNIYSPEGKQKPNLIAEFDFGKEITIGINAHYDTVPVNRQEWKTDPFKLTVSGGKAFGRGASDDKAGIAIALSLIQSIKSNVNIELIITCDEEIGSADGLKWLIQNKREKIKSDAVIVLDAEDKIIIGASGVASGRILIKGSEVHAGFPFLGKNAK